MLETETPTTAAVLNQATRGLAGAGIERARSEATGIWASVVGGETTTIWLARDKPVDPDALAEFRRKIARRASGEPLAYVTGTAAFRLLELKVGPEVLIPRPETEGLVDMVLKWGMHRETEDWGCALDLCTGSGCVALSLAAEGRFSVVTGTDSSRQAIALAMQNQRMVAHDTRLRFLVGDLFEPIAGERFDAIVSNPPYLTVQEFAKSDPCVRCFEPRMALASGEDGLEHTSAILAGARRYLRQDGLLALEIDSRRSEAVCEAAGEAGWSDVCVTADIFGRPRYLLAKHHDGSFDA